MSTPQQPWQANQSTWPPVSQPHSAAPPAYAQPAPPPPPRKSRAGLVVIAVFVAVGLLGGGAAVFAALAGGGDGARPAAATLSARPVPNPFDRAVAECDHNRHGTEVLDNGHTLVIDMKGAEEPTGVSVIELACLLGQLGTPAAIIEEMEATRALDGRRTDGWAGYTASWSYHPDQGLDVIIRQ